MIDPTEAAVAALAKATCTLQGDGGLYTAFAVAQLAALTSEDRDKVLLGFALAELGFAELRGPHSVAPDNEGWIVTVNDKAEPWNRHYFRGPTPLAAIEAALKEVGDD